MLILAAVSIATLTGENGILTQANTAKENTIIGTEKEQVEMAYISAAINKLGDEVTADELQAELEKTVGLDKNDTSDNGDGTLLVEFIDTVHYYKIENGNVTHIKESTLPKLEEIKQENNILEKTTRVVDKMGNKVVIPEGFKIALDSGITASQGVVIEDEEKNQFVWVPVSNIDGSQTYPIIKDDGNKIYITLGRYTFDDEGIPNIVQKGSEYAETTIEAITNGEVDQYKIKDSVNSFYDQHYEMYKEGAQETYITAKDLKGFITSVKNNKGYYIARYEASYGSGSSSTDYKPLSQKSIANSKTSMNYEKGTLWNFVSQSNAASASKNMYGEDARVESDLINSYAWDTAIVYIENCSENSNYANEWCKGTDIANTGETGDMVCNICDMASNLWEVTTEYINVNRFTCTIRSGVYSYSYYGSFGTPDFRYAADTYTNIGDDTFRVLLYNKQNT